MATDPRRLSYGEKRFSLFTSEKGRDRADAQRQIAALNAQGQHLDIASRHTALLAQQNEQLAYISERLYVLEQMFLDFMNAYMADRSTPGSELPPPPPSP
jgi:hypothetical protein